MSDTIGELLAAACQRYRGRLALVRGDETRSYGRCAFTSILAFVSGIWGVILRHQCTGGTVTFAPFTPESWVDHIEAA